jgi:DNA-binding protein HU-beta
VLHAQGPGPAGDGLFCGRLLVPLGPGSLAPQRRRNTFHWPRQVASVERLVRWLPAGSPGWIASGAGLGALRGGRIVTGAAALLASLRPDPGAPSDPLAVASGCREIPDFLVAAWLQPPYDWRASFLAVGPSPTRLPISTKIPKTRPPSGGLTRTMNKADLVNLVAARTELTKTEVSLVVDAAIETIIDSVVEGKKVSILGFGSFEPRERSARQGLNPKTGDKIKIPAKRVPAFTAGKLFKDRVQG